MATAQTSGKVGVNTATPTETFNVKGTVRITELPINGASASIYTKTDGTASAAKDQTLAATRTVVVDENGVLGTVNGLPVTQAATTGDNLQIKSMAKCVKGAVVNGSYQFVTGQTSTIDFPNYSFQWHVTNGGSTTGGNEFLVKNNTATASVGIHKGLGGDIPSGTAGDEILAPGQWVSFGGHVNWDTEWAGEFIYYTSDYQGYNIRYWTQKFTGTTIPSFCWTITAYEGSTVAN